MDTAYTIDITPEFQFLIGNLKSENCPVCGEPTGKSFNSS